MEFRKGAVQEFQPTFMLFNWCSVSTPCPCFSLAGYEHQGQGEVIQFLRHKKRWSSPGLQASWHAATCLCLLALGAGTVALEDPPTITWSDGDVWQRTG